MLARTLAALALAILVAPPATLRAAVPSGPRLSFVSLPGYRTAVQGSRWPAGARIAFSVQSASGVQVLHLRPTAGGRFLVGINAVDLCDGSRLEADDTADHRVILRGPTLACPPNARPHRPVLTLLKGKLLTPGKVAVFGPAPVRHLVSLEVGDILYLWEPGEDRPAFWPSPDFVYLTPEKRGRTVDQDCSGRPSATPADCTAGFYWEWIATRPGRTAIDLAPPCRRLRPACGLHDLLIELRIDL